MQYLLKKPVTFDGNEVKSIDLDFDKLAGRDLAQAEQRLRKELQPTGEVLFMVEADGRYIALICAIAADVPVELLNTLKAQDYMRVMAETRSFLMSSDSAEPAASAE